MKPINTKAEAKIGNSELTDAFLIFQNARLSSISLYQAFELARAKRGKPGGMTTDLEQDILRAMLVMACAGLDSALKQVIRDALPLLVQTNPEAQAGLEKFVERQIRGEDIDIGTNVKYLAKVLASSSPHRRVVESYIAELTGDSLQSANQLFKAVNVLGVDPKEVGADKATLRPIFEARNQIIHELDIDLDGERRKRNIRGMGLMIEWTDCILGMTKAIIEAVDKLIPPKKRLHRRRL